MTLLFSLFLMVQDVPAALAADAEPDVAQEIVVIGQKLKNWRGVIRYKKAGATCKTKRSSGDKAVDAIGCAAMLQCDAELQPRIAAIHAASSPDAEKKQLIRAFFKDEYTPCFKQKHMPAIDALARQRASK
jgi:hypothetical protein